MKKHILSDNSSKQIIHPMFAKAEAEEELKEVMWCIDSISEISNFSRNGKERVNKTLEEAVHSVNKVAFLKFLNYIVFGFFFLSSALLIFALIFSSIEVEKIKNPITILEYNRNALYWLYDNYWNSWLGTNIVEGNLNEGFGYSGTDYYLWLLDYYKYDSE